MNLSIAKSCNIKKSLVPAYMSSDEEGPEGTVGFITHQPSWQSAKFKEYKAKLDIKYKQICSTKSRRLLQQRVVGDVVQKNVPELPDELKWIADV